MSETVIERSTIGLRPKAAVPIDVFELDVPTISKPEQRTIAHAIDFLTGCYLDVIEMEKGYGPLYDRHVPRGATCRSTAAWDRSIGTLSSASSRMQEALIEMVLLACGRIAALPKDWSEEREEVDVSFAGRHGNCAIRTTNYLVTVSFDPFDEDEMHLTVVPIFKALKVATAGLAKGGEK